METFNFSLLLFFQFFKYGYNFFFGYMGPALGASFDLEGEERSPILVPPLWRRQCHRMHARKSD
jgi:hypothetical protein